MSRLALTADTRAALAALARPAQIGGIARLLIIDDTDEDATQILSVVTERSLFNHTSSVEVQS